MHQGSIGPTKLLMRRPRQIDRSRRALPQSPARAFRILPVRAPPAGGRQREKLRSLRQTLRRIILTLNTSARARHSAKPCRLPCATNVTRFLPPTPKKVRSVEAKRMRRVKTRRERESREVVALVMSLLHNAALFFVGQALRTWRAVLTFFDKKQEQPSRTIVGDLMN